MYHVTNEQANYLKAQNVIKIQKSRFKTRNETMPLLSTNSKTGNRAGSNLSFLETHSIMYKIQSKQIVEHTIATMINRYVYIANEGTCININKLCVDSVSKLLQ